MFFSRHELYLRNTKGIDLSKQKHMERIKSSEDMLLPWEFDEVKPNKDLICYFTDIIVVQTFAVSEPEIRRSRT